MTPRRNCWAFCRGIEALGSTPRRLALMLGRAGLGPRSRVVELACGKGAVAVEVAHRLGCRVLGVDAFQPFLDAGEEAGRRRGVAERMGWRRGDARAFREGAGRWDAAIMAGLDGFERAAPLLRGLVRPGGVYVLDDAPRAPGVSGPADVPSRAEARALFAALGDEVIEERAMPARDIRRVNAGLYARIERNAASLRRQRPDLAAALRAFMRRQREASALLEGPLRPVLWAVRRAGAGRAGSP